MTLEEQVQVSAMRGRGWSITAISKHLGKDRKTVRSYLEREERGEPYQRAKPNKPDLFEPYLGYLRSRFSELPFTTPDLFMNVTDGMLCH